MTTKQPSARAGLLNLLHAYRADSREAAVEAHRREVLLLAADVLEGGNPDRSPEFSDGVDWAVEVLRAAAVVPSTTA
jgi:hypothetical protein